MLEKRSEKPERADVTAEAAEMHRYVAASVAAHGERGQQEAVYRTARALGISSRRVLGILHGEVKRVWADELARARRWQRAELDRAVAHYAHQAALTKLAADKWDEEWPDG